MQSDRWQIYSFGDTAGAGLFSVRVIDIVSGGVEEREGITRAEESKAISEMKAAILARAKP